MISILLAMLFNPWTLGGIVVLVVAAVALYFLAGPVVLWKIVADVRTWIAVGGVLAVLAFAHGEKQNQELKADLTRIEQQQDATKDALATTQLRSEQKTQRAAQTSRLQAAIQQAAPGTEEDALLDAIAAERPEYHGAQAAGQPAAGAGAVSADGVRKQPDVTVVP